MQRWKKLSCSLQTGLTTSTPHHLSHTPIVIKRKEMEKIKIFYTRFNHSSIGASRNVRLELLWKIFIQSNPLILHPQVTHRVVLGQCWLNLAFLLFDDRNQNWCEERWWFLQCSSQPWSWRAGEGCYWFLQPPAQVWPCFYCYWRHVEEVPTCLSQVSVPCASALRACTESLDWLRNRLASPFSPSSFDAAIKD